MVESAKIVKTGDRISIETKNGLNFSGEQLGSVQHGQGSIIFEDGATYSGYWKEGRFQGKGTFKNVKGFVYTGDW